MASSSRLQLDADAATEVRRLVRTQARIVEGRLLVWEADLANEDAIHDVRTALRRYRVLVRCFKRDLGPKARGRVRRLLRDASRATSDLRDLHVLAAWIATLPASGAARHVMAQAAGDAVAGVESACRTTRASWDEARRLQRGARGRKVRRPSSRPFGAAAAAALRAEVACLGDGLAAFDPQAAPTAVHSTRIAAKRVRYLIEAVVGRSPDARRIVEWCRTFQSLVGDWRDASLAVRHARCCPTMSGRDLLIRRLMLRRRQALADAHRFVSDAGAWRTARRDALAIARRYALGSRRLPRPARRR